MLSCKRMSSSANATDSAGEHLSLLKVLVEQVERERLIHGVVLLDQESLQVVDVPRQMADLGSLGSDEFLLEVVSDLRVVVVRPVLVGLLCGFRLCCFVVAGVRVALV